MRLWSVIRLERGVIMIEKILERLKTVGWVFAEYFPDETAIHRVTKKSIPYDEVVKIVQEVAKEYGKDTNVRSNGWIPCSERLPQENEPETALCEIVNITLKNGAVTVGWCNRYLEKWFALDEHCDYPISYKYEDVTAWQPIPAPYLKGELHEPKKQKGE